ncbi:golgin subfamily A member 6-like protein 22 [Osmia bicornis bicornis]|uniref:golgin subfamily A member 6-like protein 22 n=1 Tax=Osmia bicornis bicornis TaxID=1437191 RepID=UPI001EAED061|nr:golgin subfamily A member 6-like protein 22 [Osmia bicornis bicornis]
MADKAEEGAVKRSGEAGIEDGTKEKKDAEGREEPRKSEKGGKRGRPSNIEVLRRERTMSIGSMENLEEIWKRKREEGSEEGTQKGKDDEGKKRSSEWMFKESNVTERSPEKKKERREGVGEVGEIKELIKDLGRDLGGKMERVEENMRDLRNEVREGIEKLKEDSMRREKWWAEQKREMEGKIEFLIRKIEELEEKGEGGTKWNEMEEKVHKTVQEVIEKRKEEIGGVEDAIEEVKELGASERGKEVSMMLLKIKSNELKRRIMENKKALKGREDRIEEDLTWAERKT